MDNVDPGAPTRYVSITIVGSTVTVDGSPVAHDGTTPLQSVALSAAHERIAAPLRRPVRAILLEEGRRISLVLHPDGHTSDVTSMPAPGSATTATTPDGWTPAPPYAAPVTSPAPTAAPPATPIFVSPLPTPTTPATPATPVTSPTRTGSAPTPPVTTTPWSANGTPAPAPTPSPPPSPTTDTRTALRQAESRSFLTRNQSVAPAQSGLRGLLNRVGIRTGPSAAELAERADVAAVSRHWTGPRTIAVVNGKGGAGKTPTTVLLSALFARHGGSGVLAWDNNETRGTLGWRTEQGPHEAHVLDLLPQSARLLEPHARAADLAAYVHHQTGDKYDVLRSNPTMLPHQQRLTAQDFDAVHLVATKYFRLILVDSGNDETAPHWLRMIDHSAQLVLATTTRPDHAEAGRLLLDALRERDEHSRDLADNAVVIVSQADREEASAAAIAGGFSGLARAAVTIPYDRALRAPWLRFDALDPTTQRAYLAAAAVVSNGL